MNANNHNNNHNNQAVLGTGGKILVGGGIQEEGKVDKPPLEDNKEIVFSTSSRSPWTRRYAIRGRVVVILT